jgi:hypothetical protein
LTSLLRGVAYQRVSFGTPIFGTEEEVSARD